MFCLLTSKGVLMKVKISLPEMDADIKVEVKRKYLQAVGVFGAAEGAYVLAKSDGVIGALLSARDQFKNKVGSAASVLLSNFRLAKKKSKEVDEFQKISGAALFYLCDIYDVIPDYVPHIGYLDDAHVLNLCFALLRKNGHKLSA